MNVERVENNTKYREIEGFLADDSTYNSILSASDFACSNNQEIPVILIDGAEGLGKRLIANIIIEKYKEIFSEKVIVHLWTGEDITDLFIKTLHDKKKQNFIDAIYKPDVLVLSDINYLERKPETTLELLRCMKSVLKKKTGS
jgi:chromosomal replication initiation ATPase DnaA